ncbi:hypothetical protein KA025_01280 [Candidatus Saccharibacteria bacterium]|jgi:hypothetical protein|nr:hypothetical protein [Candidatus Saccharibacteria bacterium]MBP7834699.1 hypothetical protein [Candidatus Saccharibacteria bacterium]
MTYKVSSVNYRLDNAQELRLLLLAVDQCDKAYKAFNPEFNSETPLDWVFAEAIWFSITIEGITQRAFPLKWNSEATKVLLYVLNYENGEVMIDTTLTDGLARLTTRDDEEDPMDKELPNYFPEVY